MHPAGMSAGCEEQLARGRSRRRKALHPLNSMGCSEQAALEHELPHEVKRWPCALQPMHMWRQPQLWPQQAPLPCRRRMTQRRGLPSGMLSAHRRMWPLDAYQTPPAPPRAARPAGSRCLRPLLSAIYKYSRRA